VAPGDETFAKEKQIGSVYEFNEKNDFILDGSRHCNVYGLRGL
jgi:hypothetical protein